MKCWNCQKNIEHEMTCIFCKTVFCSYKCLRSHIILSHNQNLLINTSISKKASQKIIKDNSNNISYKNNNNSQIQISNDIIQSPYLIPGIFYNQRKYEGIYKLENFIPILENGKLKIIGGGSFGQVLLVLNTKNKKHYAIKHMIKKNLKKKLTSLECIYKEINIQSRIDHPNILPILFVRETSSDFDLVLEYAKEGSLFHYIRKNKSLDESLAFYIFIQVVNAVYFLHKNDLIHRDIKPENILIFENNMIKLCDFGWCVKLESGEQRGTFCGTTEYMSPELINHEEYSKEIDVWSLGVLLYEMVHGYSPFRPEKPNFNARDVMNNIRMHRLKFNKNISERCKDLIYHLLDEEPERRYKVEDIFYSDFVKYFEGKKFGMPDKYLIEKYKFKVSKAKDYLYTESNSYKRNTGHNKSSSNIKYQKNSIFLENNKNEFNDNISNIHKKVKMANDDNNIYSRERKISSHLFDDNMNNNKSFNKKISKNKTFEYFPSLTFIDNKINVSYLGCSKSNKKIQNIKNFDNNIDNNNMNKNKLNIVNKCNNEKKKKLREIPKNETKIKAIIINNYFPNVLQDNENYYEEIKNEYAYKKSFHIKPLKISKIPISKKYNKNNINKYKLKSIINLDYLLMKKYLTPKSKLINKTNNNLSKDKNNNNESKIIEINRLNCCYTTKNSEDKDNNKYDIKNYENKKIYTRNYHSYKYDSMNDNSKINNTKFNIRNNNFNSNSYENIYSINDSHNNISYNKIKEGRIHHTKSMNQLNLNFLKENIKSLLNSNQSSNINSISINSENKSILIKQDKKYRIKENYSKLNLKEIKRVNSLIYNTRQNSPLNNFNNNFVHTIFNKDDDIITNRKKEKISLSNNISTLNIYDLSNIKSNENKNNFNKKNEYAINDKNKCENQKKYKININSKKENKYNYKIKYIPKINNNKKKEELNLEIKINNNQKNLCWEKCICGTHNNLNTSYKKYINNKSFKSITRNNSNRIINNESSKLMKKLELNNFFSNIKGMKSKILNYRILNHENAFNNATNEKVNTIINMNQKEKQYENKIPKGNINYKELNRYPSLKNLKNKKENIKYSNTMKKKLNDIYQKEPKIAVSTTTIPRYKKRMNRVINDENINQLNFENQNKYKGEYNKITFINKKINKDDTFCICHY